MASLWVLGFFWVLLLYYSALEMGGTLMRGRKYPYKQLDEYPSVSILIPAYNEGVVMRDTIQAMMKIEYPGELRVFLLDDNSSDETGDIGRQFSEKFSRIDYIQVPPGEPKGKSRVLNYGLTLTDSKYYLVYDADNQPEPDAVRCLVEAAEQTEHAVGAVGYVKTINQSRNVLTRMIALEFQVFQLLMQCGRWKFWKMGSLAGTNMLLQIDAIRELGGYDEYALAEDAELTMRVAANGWLLPVVPEAKTWEQEPETLRTFIKQRTRWLLGNLYLFEKIFRSKEFWNRKCVIHTLQHISTYFFFVVMLLLSNVLFVLGLFGIFRVQTSSNSLLMIWFMSYVVFTLHLMKAQDVEEDIGGKQVWTSVLMYFTYATMFIFLLLRSMFMYIKSFVRDHEIKWDKTERFTQ